MVADLPPRRGLIPALLLVLALIASGARGVLPAGYMVNAGLQAGEIAIVLCTDHGRTPAALDLESGAVRALDHAPAPGKPVADPPCLFAAAAVAGPPPTGPALAAPMAVAAATDARPVRVSVGQGLAAPPPPATGPPLARA